MGVSGCRRPDSIEGGHTAHYKTRGITSLFLYICIHIIYLIDRERVRASWYLSIVYIK